MKKFLIAGIIVVIVPLLGVPILWKTWILILTGLYIIYQTFVYKKEDSRKDIENNLDKIYIENEKNTEE